MCNRPYFTNQKMIYTLVVFSLFEDAIKKAMLWHEAHSIAFLLFYDVFRISFFYLIVFRMAFSLPMKSSTFSLVRQRGGSRRRRLVPAQPVKQCWS